MRSRRLTAVDVVLAIAVVAGVVLALAVVVSPRTPRASPEAPGTQAAGTEPPAEPSPASGSGASVPASAAGGSRSTPASASIEHVLLVIMENRSYKSIVGNKSAPYLNSLIQSYGLATSYTAVAHPSQPNYLALFSGSTQNVRDDGVHDINGANLADQLETHGRTWRVVAENVPAGCYAGATYSGGEDGNGKYARKHEPAISFTDISQNPARCANIVDLRHFSTDAANFQMIIPNLCHDMHDCSTADGDAFLKGFLAPIVASAAAPNTLVVVTFDEGSDDDSAGGGGAVATVLVGPMVRAGYRSTVGHDHYSLLRTIEDLWSLGCLNRSCAANDMSEFFVTP